MTAVLAFVVQSFLVVAVPYAVWRIGRLGAIVPWVVTQIVVGICFGPSLLGRLAPSVASWVFDTSTLAPLTGIASIAVLFFAFVTGLHLDPGTLRGRGPGFVLMAAGTILVPTALGVLSGALIAICFPDTPGPAAKAGTFAAAIGICTGVTALPVLGAILHEMDLLRQRLGQLALGLAACNDAALWFLLAALLTDIANTRDAGTGLLLPGIGLLVWLAVLVGVVRPLMQRLAVTVGTGGLGEGGLVAACSGALASAAVTEVLGLHFILGAFLAGALMPVEMRRPLLDRLEMATVVILLPFFFVVTGLKTTIDLSSGPFVAIFLLVTVAAVLGKFGGTAAAAWLAGEPPVLALALGSLMQTKGLMEVVVASVLRDAGVISPIMFSALILMALVSTALAMPLTRLLTTKVPPHET